MIDWTHWHNEPFLVGGLIFLGWLYGILTGPLRARLAPAGTPYPRSYAVKFYSALVCFYLAVGSPLDQIGERFLFSAHMLQHQLIIYPAAILFLRGLPPWLFGRANPDAAPRRHFLLHPIICATVYVVVVSSWHAPLLYDWALQDKFVHILEHFTFFGASLLLWWPIFSPAPHQPPISYPGQMFYLVAVTIGMTPVFAYITFSQDVLYPTYEFAPRIINMTPQQDQILAGAMMKLVGMAVSLGVFALAFYRWHQASERRS